MEWCLLGSTALFVINTVCLTVRLSVRPIVKPATVCLIKSMINATSPMKTRPKRCLNLIFWLFNGMFMVMCCCCLNYLTHSSVFLLNGQRRQAPLAISLLFYSLIIFKEKTCASISLFFINYYNFVFFLERYWTFNVTFNYSHFVKECKTLDTVATFFSNVYLIIKISYFKFIKDRD